MIQNQTDNAGESRNIDYTADSFVSGVYKNLASGLLMITEDKARLCLTDYAQKMEKKRGWWAPIGILTSTIATLVSSNFNNVIFDALTWRAVFIVVTLASAIWLFYSLYEARESVNIDYVIGQMKQGSVSEPLVKSERKVPV